jgi:hypothetical protein
VKKIQGAGLLQGYVDVATLHPYRCQAAAGEARGRRKDGWIVSSLYTLGSLARGMGYLVCPFCHLRPSLTSCIDRSECRDVLRSHDSHCGR